MLYDFNIPNLSILLFSVAALCLIYIIAVYCRRISIIGNLRRDCESADNDDDSVMPHVSVVVYSPSDAESLAECLPPILEQDYKGIFEVIVVNDGNIGDSDIVVKRLKTKYPNLYLTFSPEGTRVLSHKKLALTIGIKAAKGDVVIITDATTKVPSVKWLRTMTCHFLNPDVDLVLGYNHYAMPDRVGYLTCAFDETADAVAWLSAAQSGKAYRACPSNMALRRQLFFDHKGYSNSLNLNHGEDDLFIYEIAGRDNTKVELSADTIGSTGYEHGLRRILKHQRMAHAFTGRRLPKLSRRLMSTAEWMMWILVAASVAGYIAAGILNGFGLTLAIVLILSMLVAVTIAWRKALSALGYGKMMLSLPLLAATRPLRNILVNMRCGGKRQANYTWQK